MLSTARLESRGLIRALLHEMKGKNIINTARTCMNRACVFCLPEDQSGELLLTDARVQSLYPATHEKQCHTRPTWPYYPNTPIVATTVLGLKSREYRLGSARHQTMCYGPVDYDAIPLQSSIPIVDLRLCTPGSRITSTAKSPHISTGEKLFPCDHRPCYLGIDKIGFLLLWARSFGCICRKSICYQVRRPERTHISAC